MNLKNMLPWAMLAALCIGNEVEARVIRVGPDSDVKKISDAARVAQDGDVVEIAAGEWRGDVALWLQTKLTIRGVGGRPVLHADGQSAEGKAIWVIRSGNFKIENIEFRGARVVDGNGAGVRFEAGKLTVRDCAFLDNQMGLLTGNNGQAELTIENSVFAEAPEQYQPLPHLLYAGRIASLKITGSRFHAGHVGHLIKSRARQTDLKYNLIADGPNGKASYEIDLPNGGLATLVGNVVVQSEQTSNPIVIAYGAEGNAWEQSMLNLANNTLVSEGIKPAWFIRVWRERLPKSFRTLVINNLWSGLGIFDYGLPGASAGNVLVWHRVFEGRSVLDYRLANDSWIKGIDSPSDSESGTLTPTAEFSFPVGIRELGPLRKLTPGAFQ
jgi:hypothetical protein